jgi:hypothetical protein
MDVWKRFPRLGRPQFKGLEMSLVVAAYLEFASGRRGCKHCLDLLKTGRTHQHSDAHWLGALGNDLLGCYNKDVQGCGAH